MAKLLFIQLMISAFTSSLLQITSADIISVNPGENITLTCNVTYHSDILWFRLKSEEINLLIMAKKGKLETHFSPSFCVNESHIDVTKNGSLAINGVKESDLGFYYCRGQNTTCNLHFGKPVRLKFTGNRSEESVASAVYQDHYQVINIILTCACFISFLTNIICICVFRSRVQAEDYFNAGKSVSSDVCCSDTSTYSAEKEINLHYATITHPKEAAKRSTTDSDSVTYAGIRHVPT